MSIPRHHIPDKSVQLKLEFPWIHEDIDVSRKLCGTS